MPPVFGKESLLISVSVLCRAPPSEVLSHFIQCVFQKKFGEVRVEKNMSLLASYAGAFKPAGWCCRLHCSRGSAAAAAREAPGGYDYQPL